MNEARDIESTIRGGDAIDAAIVTTRRQVIELHRRLRVPLVIWRDGRIVEVPLDGVPLPEARHATAQGAR